MILNATIITTTTSKADRILYIAKGKVVGFRVSSLEVGSRLGSPGRWRAYYQFYLLEEACNPQQHLKEATRLPNDKDVRSRAGWLLLQCQQSDDTVDISNDA